MYTVNVAGSLYVERKRRQLKLLHNNKEVAFITQPTINLHGRWSAPPTELSLYSVEQLDVRMKENKVVEYRACVRASFRYHPEKY
jgi:hypothetical protein